ncbi:hypothetical protein niasHT_002050 [Heterodera trifolii]|uniref:Choline O-acetyltransferase n=1 Tax=Heterodera trifolii TaxID=157864 RepID=A0ABD2M2R7_9BILA
MNDEKAKAVGDIEGQKAKMANEETTKRGRNAEKHWYECPLPKVPLPDLGHTLRRYLEFARVLADGSNHCRVNLMEMEKAVRDFEPIAKKMQEKLTELSEESENWINLFWLPEMYLRQRMPLPVNFSPAYVFPRRHFQSDGDWLFYAALLVRAFLDFKNGVENKKTPRETITDRFSEGNTVPLCMDQYERILNCYREPGFGEDILHDRRTNESQKRDNNWEKGRKEIGGENTANSGKCHGTNGQTEEGEQYSEAEQHPGQDDEHIVVINEQQQFVLVTRYRGFPVTAPTIARQLAKIRTIARNRIGQTVHAVGGASAGQRERAAAFWEEMKKASVNIRSLEALRSAVFVLCLDESTDAFEMPAEGEHLKNLERDGLHILHGFGSARNGLNRWFDCTIQMIVSRNGCCGLCIEHSVAEGIVIIKMAEEAMRFANENWAIKKKRESEQHIMKNANANFVVPAPTLVATEIPPPKCLSWALNERAIHLLRDQIAEFDNLVSDVQLRLLFFSHFGKSLLKAWGVSPDGFVQLAMQFAHFKLHGHLVSTYESATMRRFRYGRVDNIRAATPEALAWVKAMEERSEGEDQRKRRELFEKAVEKQAQITRENVTGNGIDNHLCALEVLSRTEAEAKRWAESTRRQKGSDGSGTERESGRALFEDATWHEMMRFPLTTSQVSTSPEFVDCFLFYGPVVRDGYGCAYNIQQDRIIFAISAWKSEKKTKVDKFKESLEEAMREMHFLMEDEQNLN